MLWKRASVQPTPSAPLEPPLSPHAFSETNVNLFNPSNDEPTSQQRKPGLFERTMGLEEQRTRNKLADALMMVVDNSGEVMEETSTDFIVLELQNLLNNFLRKRKVSFCRLRV